MKQFLIIVFAVFVPCVVMGQKIGIKTNLLYDATATINIGAEAALGHRMTLDLSGNYNGWSFGEKRWRHWMVQPEVRLWLCEKFNGHFFGLHGHYADYNVGGVNINDNIHHNRYQGFLFGAGLSYGYQWILGDKWNLEATFGAGYARLFNRKYPIAECGTATRSKHYDYWGPTKIGLSFIYIIK